MENFWEQYAKDFDTLNDFVVGKEDMQISKNEVKKLTNLGKTLELACGNGVYTKLLAKNASSLLATDLSTKMLDVAKQNLKEFNHISFKTADCLNLDFEDESFHSVFTANLLHVTDDCHKTLQEIYRVLKPNGSFYALDFTLYDMSEDDKEAMIQRFLKSYGKPTNNPEYPMLSPKSLEEIAQKEGFKVEQCYLIGESSKAVVLKARK